eukprot:CAMPEP_0182422780 /NCGR_PEP_ID=MMETSP1167-20130531/8557_1 /TAXON_ID=2988 /ORGANISM="Mallomonas Sp, Strain CCMP3275" /LENGTH=372 /DNA_ID=CAMNT_0024601125 /DNA_START=102 /DNA_END=1220 /DNA_ORIENTATION=-
MKANNRNLSGDENGDELSLEAILEESETIAVDGEEKKTDLQETEKKKRKRKARKREGPNLWIYIKGLPHDITTDEIHAHFSKVGLIALNPLDQQRKIKLYLDESGIPKGDCSLCYNAIESVEMALEILDGGFIRPNCQIHVERAHFTQKITPSIPPTSTEPQSDTAVDISSVGGNQDGNRVEVGAPPPDRDIDPTSSRENAKRDRGKPSATRAQLKVAKGAIAQALSWTEDDVGVCKKQALRIVVLEGLFTPSDFNQESFSDELEQDVASECSKCGEVEKITVFSKNPRGIVIVKFHTAFAAEECIRIMHGRYFAGRQLKCYYWDGTTNYSIVSEAVQEAEEKEEQKRLDEFGDWLDHDQEELPDELKLRTE